MKRNIYIILALIFLGAGAVNLYAWKTPTATPPSQGVQPPVTALINEQLKAGTLGVNGMFAVFGNAVLSGGVKIADGTQKEFYVLTSDSAGNASWKSLPAKPVTTHKLGLGDCPAGSTKMTDRGLAYCGYWVNTGAASYCNKGDLRIAAVDTGTSAHKGGNHGITLAEPNGCIGWEGPSNFGGPGCAVQCRTTTVYQ
ncbi:MAG: hypothetical protein JWP09_826 [Candidatus Taylorbacteria bacterium]|nr:hypothetical protein [Candidatus Taylorbacteria bacterium]